LFDTELLDADGPLLGPVRLMSTQRRPWVTPFVGRDDVRVYVDNR
jgi:hypothetical protein